ncbi:hypothetical protein BDV38DRAFT_296043 [Aspergillus pseudotamarii]|uniref:Uncharacterized protein n=1 Tax=Aspergillus pseudotamarii TaxID=132259 RepID=A0A5N6SJH4_ASPPS|nr:uncharacterized protein BDV38DRAFT_296043 [Aspergillus pseudotamarii]KAE8133533.1 hypothetical protein BDV38DRAFT_296043 [Aspergillus pseudotamarii]
MGNNELDNSGTGPLKVPGFNNYPLELTLDCEDRFHDTVPMDWFSSPLTARELAMLNLMETLTDRPGWYNLIFDKHTVTKWKEEAMTRPIISHKAWDWCLAELRDKAIRFKETGQILVLNSGSAVCKSDTIIPSSVGLKIQQFVSKLSDECGDRKDWEPSSNKLIWNMIDPSFFPLVYGQTRVLVNGGCVPLEQTLETYGHGEVAPRHDQEREILEEFPDSDDNARSLLFSHRFQWLPCEVEFCGPAGSTDVRITSYVNNLHPSRHRSFYETLEEVVSQVIEPWNETLIKGTPIDSNLSSPPGRAPRRIQTFGVEWRNEYPKWAEDLPTERDGDLEACHNALARVRDYVVLPEYGVKVEWDGLETKEIPQDWESTVSLKDVVDAKYTRLFRFEHSDPGLYSYEEWKAGKTAKSIVGPTEHDIQWKIDPKVWSSLHDMKDPIDRYKILEGSRKRCRDHDYYTVKLQETFRDKGLQVIVKLEGIELTPESTSYPGEDWHTDGLLNEHIVGTAVYFFDMENVTGSRLSFRQEIEMNPGVYQFEGWDVPYLEKLFGVKDETPAFQELGSVSIGQGRLIVFPNALHHRMEPFELISKCRAGHLRFLTLWLVDPYYRICSTRNVPPQRHDWWAEEAQSLVTSAHSLPQELASMVINETHKWPMDLTEAQQHRLERGKDSAIAHGAMEYLNQDAEINLFKPMY